MCFTYRSLFVSSVKEPRSAEPERKREPNIPAASKYGDNHAHLECRPMVPQKKSSSQV